MDNINSHICCHYSTDGCLFLLGTGSVEALPRQRIHTQHRRNVRVVFGAVRVAQRNVGDYVLA
jgi:hypothetical protein